MDVARSTGELVRTREDVEASEWESFGEVEGVHTKTLWRDPCGGSYAGLLRIDAGGRIPPHAHRLAVHHMWVVDGSCEASGRRLEAGSYAFVPVGAEHEIPTVGPDGCALFYLYLVTAEVD